MSSILIMSPRLDCTFKEGHVPSVRGTWPPIRDHWHNFTKNLKQAHIEYGDSVEVLELPLWQFTPQQVNDRKPDRVYVPHKESHNFSVSESIEIRYYMQTVFPWMFTIDHTGWGAGMAVSPIDYNDGLTGSPALGILRRMIENNQSKFDQPERKKVPWDDYIFFACQIPHDETIRFHSDVLVEEALLATCLWAQDHDYKLVVKGHPVNPGSMVNCKRICSKYGHVTYVTDYSIHDLLENCRAFFCVNSGTGWEAVLHQKPIFMFGRAEYDRVANVIEDMDIESAWKRNVYDASKYRALLDRYLQICYDTTEITDFHNAIYR